MTLRIDEELNPRSLLAPCRVTVFAAREIGKRRKVVSAGVAWQGWNADASMEERMARLPGSGSFYWPNALRAFLWARAQMRADASIEQIRIETISARPVARIWR